MVIRRGIIRLLLGALVLLPLSCVRTGEPEEPSAIRDDSAVEGQPVTITFNMLNLEPGARTRALGEGKEALTSLRLAVFGGSGYLKEYVEALPLGEPQDYTYQTTDKDENPVTVTTKSYTYSVTLSLADSPRTIHFIGNGPETLPFGYDNAILPVQRGGVGEMSYWQVLSLPNGIRAKRNDDGDFVNVDGEVIPDGGSGYVADAVTEQAFRNIPLIRNWAKIELEVAENSAFTPSRFALVNFPSRGSIAPYSADNGFISSYQNYTYPQLEGISYPGNMPTGTTFDANIPVRADFESASPGAGVAPVDGGALYLYERPAPSESFPPTYVIVYGYYNNPADSGHKGYYYYKIDLMETWSEEVGSEVVWKSRYYPIFRNFKYQIKINNVLSAGHATPQDAVNSVGSGDVSANITTSQLADISDGASRLIISPWMAQTYTEEHGVENPAITDLQAFFSKSPTGEADMSSGSVKVELLGPDDEGEDILYDLSINPEPDAGGWRHITFKNHGPGRTVRSQAIRVIGTHENGRLYRDIIITVQPIQPMLVTCDHKIGAYKGAKESMSVSIPDGLMESVFPLDFIIEPEAMTLTPDTEEDNNNLPVSVGKSISENDPYQGKTTFRFKRTLSWDEYRTLSRTQDSEGQYWRSFSCHFRSNCVESATRIWVYNPFFEKASAAFVTRHDRRFSRIRFNAPIYTDQIDRTLPLEFLMAHDSDDEYPKDYPTVTVTVSGLNLPSEILSNYPNITRDESNPNVYYYTPQNAEDRLVVLDFLTTTTDPDEISVNLTAEGYYSGSVVPVRFPMAQLVDCHPLSGSDGWSNSTWSNVAWGYLNSDNSKTVLFGYKDHPDLPNATVTLNLLSGLCSFNSSSVKTVTVTPTGPRSSNGDANYHEVELKTISGQTDAHIQMSANGYVVEDISNGRFKGRIRTFRVTSSNVLKKNNTYGFSQSNPNFTYYEDNGQIRVTFSRISADPDGKVVFATAENASDRTYTMTIECDYQYTQELMWVDMFFVVSDSTVQMPDSNLFRPDFGEVYRYWGSNNQYIWSIPRGHKTASLTFTAPSDHDVVLGTLYVKYFEIANSNQGLYEGGTKVYP